MSLLDIVRRTYSCQRCTGCSGVASLRSLELFVCIPLRIDLEGHARCPRTAQRQFNPYPNYNYTLNTHYSGQCYSDSRLPTKTLIKIQLDNPGQLTRFKNLILTFELHIFRWRELHTYSCSFVHVKGQLPRLYLFLYTWRIAWENFISHYF